MAGLTAGEIVRLVGGALEGPESTRVTSVAPLVRAGPTELSFLAAPRYARAYAQSRAGIVLVAPELSELPSGGHTRILIERPHDAVLKLLPLLYQAPARSPGVDPTARLGRGVHLGREVTIGAYAVIGDDALLSDGAWIGEHCVVGEGVQIGEESRLHPAVTCYPGTRLGKRVIVHSGSRLGSDGFGYVFRDGAHQKIPHVGQCIIEDDVEIGANVAIDRGSVDDTRIGAGTKIDNLVHIAHNVQIGRLCLLMAQVGIAGSTRMEDGVIVAGQAGINGHITIGAQARIAGQAGVFHDVPAGESWSGYPARPHRESLRASAALFKLAGMLRPLERLLQEEERRVVGENGPADSEEPA